MSIVATRMVSGLTTFDPASELDREAISLAAPAAKHRSRAVAREFQREYPCTSTGLPTGACPATGRPHCAARLRRGRLSPQSPMADNRRSDSEGQMGAPGLRSVTCQQRLSNRPLCRWRWAGQLSTSPWFHAPRVGSRAKCAVTKVVLAYSGGPSPWLPAPAPGRVEIDSGRGRRTVGIYPERAPKSQ
jgi:hypothetical protein